MPTYITKQQLTDRIVAAKIALDAVIAKNASLKLTRHSTAMKIPQVGAFQTLDTTLKVDELYGPNTKTAIDWYLQTYPNKPVSPPVNPNFANVAVTWTPPALEPAPQPKAAPKVATKKKKAKKKVKPKTVVKKPPQKKQWDLSNINLAALANLSPQTSTSKSTPVSTSSTATSKPAETTSKVKVQTKSSSAPTKKATTAKKTEKFVPKTKTEESKPGFFSTTTGKVVAGLGAVGAVAAISMIPSKEKAKMLDAVMK